MRLATANPLSESQRRFWQGLADGSLGVGLPSEAEWEKSGARQGRPDLSLGRPSRSQQSQLWRHRTGYDQRGGLFSGRRQPLRLRGDERQRLGMDPQSIWRLSLSAGRSAATGAGRPECARRCQPGAAGRRVRRRCADCALRRPRRRRSRHPRRLPRFSGGGVPIGFL
ncbi:MAG: hypothetical protein MZU95_05460 [Desulfomicrobium escambiense]|nr:hypothetical protein [Desulfomicrobium escambiense]